MIKVLDSTLKKASKLVEKTGENKFAYYTLAAILIKSIIFVRYIVDITYGLKPLYDSIWIYIPSYLFFILVFLTISFLLTNRKRLIYLFCYNLIISILLIIDLWYYRSSNNMTSLQMLSELYNLHNLWDCVFSMFRIKDIIFIVDIPMLIMYIITNWNGYTTSIRNKYIALTAVITLALFFSIGPMFFPSRFQVYDTAVTAVNMSPIGYHLLNMVDFLKYGGNIKINAAELKEIQEWFKKNKIYDASRVSSINNNAYKGILKGKNLIMIQVESLEQFVLEKTVNGKEITPNLNKMLKHSLYFTNYHEQINHGTTSDAELLANTSVYPIKDGSTFFMYPNTMYNSLPKILGKRGYRSNAFHADVSSYWNWGKALRNIGFNECVDKSKFYIDEEIGLGLSDGSYFKQIEPMILSQKYPFYSFIITLSSHAPFDLPRNYRDLNLRKELDESKIGGYFESIRYVDKQIGKFVQDLAPIMDNTVVVIYGDHEGPHQYYPEEIQKFSDEMSWIAKNDKKVPLIIYNNSIKGNRFDIVGGQIDTLPTLCYLFGIDKDEYANTAMGRNLLETNRNFAVLRAGYYVGEDANYKEHAVKGQRLADKIIRGNYFNQIRK